MGILLCRVIDSSAVILVCFSFASHVRIRKKTAMSPFGRPSDTDMSDVPLSSAMDDDDIVESPRSARVASPNPDETYSRYEKAPFRNYSLNPPQGTNYRGNGAVRKESSSKSLLQRMLSRQSRLESTVQNALGENGGPQQDRSCADDTTNSGDENWGTERPSPQWGLGRPFPKRRPGDRFRKGGVQGRKRAKRGSESGKPEGQVGTR